jgi:hypothetical protein
MQFLPPKPQAVASRWRTQPGAGHNDLSLTAGGFAMIRKGNFTRIGPAWGGATLLSLLLCLGIGMSASGGATAKDDGGSKDESSGSSWWSWKSGVANFSWGGVSWNNGGSQVTGSDKLANDSRPAEGVKAIDLHGPIDVILRQGPGRRVTVHTDDNIVPLVETVVEDGVLVIRPRAGTSARSRHPIVASVEVPSLAALKVDGSGDIECAGWDGDLLEVSVHGSGDVHIDSLHASTLAVLVHGSGDVRLSGKVARQGYDIEGSGDVKAHELVGEVVAIKISGSGDASVWATRELAIEINGSGDVHYRGPAKVTQQVHGSGDVIHE